MDVSGRTMILAPWSAASSTRALSLRRLEATLPRIDEHCTAATLTACGRPLGVVARGESASKNAAGLMSKTKSSRGMGFLNCGSVGLELLDAHAARMLARHCIATVTNQQR